MRKGQFGSTVVDVVFWLAVIALVAWILKMYVTGSLDDIFAPGEAMLGK